MEETLRAMLQKRLVRSLCFLVLQLKHENHQTLAIEENESCSVVELRLFQGDWFSPQGEIEGARVWLSTEGDGIGLYFFPVRPDLPANAKSPGELRDRMAAGSRF